MTPITALVITYNEVIHMDDLIENIKFVDEIIVVDSFSNDGTFEKLKSFDNIKLVQHKFENFADQKNFALSLAENDWVLFIDADERVTEDLKTEIQNMVNHPNNELVAFYCRFRYYFGKSPIKYSGFQTAKSYRLFQRSKCKYDESKTVHEQLMVEGESGILTNRMTHFSFRNYTHYKQKMKLYAHIKAMDLHKKGKRTTPMKSSLKIGYKFFNHFIMRLGILDGRVGYQISKLNAYEVKERYRELQKLNQKSASTV